METPKLLDSCNYRDHERLFGRLLEEEAPNLIRDPLLDLVEVNRSAGAAHLGFNQALDQEARLAQQLLRLAQVDEAAGDDVRRLAQLAVPELHRREDHEDSTFGERLAG